MENDKRRNEPPSKFESYFGKFLIFIGLFTAFFFIKWLLTPKFIGNFALYFLLIATFIYKIIRLLIEWAFCFNLSVTPKPKTTKKWSVDVLTTYCPPEPKEMVISTLKAIQGITYPHNTFLCDESDDEQLKKVCKELHVTHVTRNEKINAKAGNINNALYSVANGEICLILDPDHIPYPDFLDEVLPYFEDEKVGFVQVVQAYYNEQVTVIAKAAAQQTYQFYGPFMMGLNTFGAVPAIGANCTFRREALDSIGGHAPGLTEDMHTAMLLHAKKWKSVFNPVIVAKGLVPQSYSSYCQQQLKWARGSFDLFFHVIPKIFKQLTWKQLLYYITAPIFYLYGLVAFIDFLIPVIALFSGIIPIKISIASFFQYYLPLFVAIIAIRQFNQRWLIEEHEKGAFLLGGTLLKASWWAFLLGLINTIINKKVPYIPTPKEDQYESPVKLLLPNFIIILVSIIAIIYGLNRDFNPFNIFMAILAGINVLVLSLGNVMALQHLIVGFHRKTKHVLSKGSKTRKWIYLQKQRVFFFLQYAGIPLIILTFISLFFIHRKLENDLNELKAEKTILNNVYIPDIKGSDMQEINADVHFVYQVFQLDSLFPEKTRAFSDSCSKYAKMPYYIINFDSARLADSLNLSDTVFYKLFIYLRKKYTPVFFEISSKDAENEKDDSKLALKLNELTALASKASFPNIAWVWRTNSPNKDPFIEYNKYALAWLLVDKHKFKPEIKKQPFNIPVLIKDGSKIQSFQPTEKISKNYYRDWVSDSKNIDSGRKSYKKAYFFHEYIKGVVYNPGHDWRDSKDEVPLTINKVENDLQHIKAMGANTIRRYSPSIYDKNILKVANKKGLKVLYGFWFDPKIDYTNRKFRIWRYEREVLNKVRKLKNDTAILGWSLGNETWGLLKLNYNEPYLSMVRMAYVKMIADLAYKIKEIDPSRPIFAVEEHTPHLSSAVYAFNTYAPDVDIFGINSYYEQNISILDSVMMSVNPTQKYLVAEFGPKGYWHKEYNDYIYDSLLYEQNSFSKAENLTYQWDKYIYPNKEKNIGGIAFCWQDRYEGTATWFGITDIFGNRKPSWNSLKMCYSGDTITPAYPIPVFKIFMSKDNLEPGTYTSAIAATREIAKRDSLYYKWMVYEEKTFVNYLETSFKKGAYEIRFKVPRIKSNYRIYLYVSDNKGNVLTESSPLLIKW
jgi:cellulose synthase/poly-beta-1,6-N-acetylglucosamine synthase-like glycosyltransferase